MEDQVWKRHAAQRHAQAVHIGEVGLRRFAGLVDLGKDHLAARTVLSPPRRDLTMQRAQLTRLVAARVELLQEPEQRRALQRRITLELASDPGPVLSERTRPGPIGARLLKLAGQLAASFVATQRAHAHACPRRGLFLSSTFGALAPHQQYLRVALHAAPFVRKLHDATPSSARRAANLVDDRRTP